MADNGQAGNDSELFMVRVWSNAEAEAGANFNGKVQHMMSGKALSFADWRSLIRFMEETLGPPRPGGAAQSYSPARPDADANVS